jgi:hypothetical protein
MGVEIRLPAFGLAFGLMLAAALLAGCGERSLDLGSGSGGAGGAGGTAGTFTPTRKLDLLFVIDDSSEVRLTQANLERNFPTLVATLRSAAQGLPDLHLAVISTDMGAGDGSIAGCDSNGGKNAIFQYTARGTCTATLLDPGATYIADDGQNRNYTGPIEDVFTCIAALGESGCGFEHQLAAMTRALGADGRPAPAENQGFLRPDAVLGIVLVTNEDDCSAPTGSTLYDTRTNTNLASALGPPANFRCNEFGHLCGGIRPPRRAPNGSVGDTVTLEDCVSAEGSGMLIPVADFVAQLRALKAFPDQQIVVTAIAGPPTPYAVRWLNPVVVNDGPWPMMAHSCTGPDGNFADPAVRISQWVSAFGANGLVLPVCADSYAPALQRIAELLATAGGAR